MGRKLEAFLRPEKEASYRAIRGNGSERTNETGGRLGCRIVSRSIRTAVALGAVLLATSGIAACGGGASSDAVVQVGSTAITKATLSRWMATLAGGDFYEAFGITLPKGMVSVPADYTVCVRDLRTIAPYLAKGTYRRKCEELDESLKQQALNYLLDSEIAFRKEAELGVTVSNAEIDQRFRTFKAEHFPTEAELQQYLAQRDWTLAVELFLVKRDLLSSKASRKLKERFKSEQAMYNYVESREKMWVSRTSCRPGYIVLECKQYRGTRTTPNVRQPAYLVDEVEAGRSK